MNNRYIKNIKQNYPNLSIENCYANDIGQNNDVLIVNNSLVFRFPKYRQGIIQLKRETEILEYIKNIITTPIPHPIYQSFKKLKPGEVFTGYKLIAGVPLWKENLQSIKSPELIKELALQPVTFLAELHSIPKEKTSNVLKLKDINPRTEIFDLLGRIQNKLFPFIKDEARDKITQSF
jgi:aminoglycoside 2''-phosphotransferase